MKVLKSIFINSLTGLSLACFVAPSLANAGNNSFKEFSKETESEEVAEVKLEAPAPAKAIKASLIPAFLSETYVSGLYSDGCATFKTSAYVVASADSSKIKFNGTAATSTSKQEVASNEHPNGFEEFDKIEIKKIDITAPVAEAPKQPETFTVAQNNFGGAEAISDDSLSETRGASLQVIGETIGAAVLTANAVGNNSSNTVTGSNTVNGDAFGSASGVVNLIQNSGNNVIIQNATIVNLTLG